MATRFLGEARRRPLAALASDWASEELQWNAYRATDALQQLGVSDESVAAALDEAVHLVQRKWPAYLERPEQPDLIYADDEAEPYVSLRLPIPASAEEASALTWELSGLLVERRLNLRGLSVAFFPARQRSSDAARE